MKWPSQRRALWADRSGVAAIEYAFLASLIAVALVGALLILGVSVVGLWGEVDSAVAGTSFDTDPG